VWGRNHVVEQQAEIEPARSNRAGLPRSHFATAPSHNIATGADGRDRTYASTVEVALCH
jgi:hypothetical protein